FKFTVSGWAHTESIAADATFDITQYVTLDFNAGTGTLQLTPSTLTVTVNSSGLYSGTVAGTVKDAILKVVPPIVQSACNGVQPTLNSVSNRTQELTQQLRTLDDNASTRLDEGVFLPDGIILRGSIALTSRKAAVIKMQKTVAGDAHSALESWIPGG